MESPTNGQYISKVDQQVDLDVSEVLIEKGSGEYLVRNKLVDGINYLNRADWLQAMGYLRLEKRI
jgi:hypothetical protein